MITMMKWRKRGRLEIIGTILSVCEKDALKTTIMYKCNLNYDQIGEYLQLLLDRGLLEKRERSPTSKVHVYRTTELGQKCIEAYKQFTGIFNEP